MTAGEKIYFLVNTYEVSQSQKDILNHKIIFIKSSVFSFFSN